MRTRKSIMTKEKVDYEFEATRGMCEGCNKTGDWHGDRCTAFLTPPSFYVRANECPMNKRIKPAAGRKVLVGQQKQGRF